MAVDNIVILNDVFACIKVVAFNTLLRCFECFTDGFILDWRLFINPESIHKCSNAFTLENTHKIIFSRNEELRLTWITLASATSTKLVINTTRFVTLRTDHDKSTELLHTFAKFDIGTTTGNIGCEGDCTLFTSFFNNCGLTLVILGV
ncbi:hypothetical protein D3C87_1372960 [compost metagenome]